MKIKFLLVAGLMFVSLGYAQKQWSLKECVDHAVTNNITVQQNALNVELAEINVKDAQGNFLPDLNANTGNSFNFGSGFDPVSQNRVNTSFFGGNININSGITIFNGFRNLNVYKQAQLGVERSKLTLEDIQNDISLLVVNGYLNILFAKENLNAAKVQAQISKKQVEAAQERFDAGFIPKGDLLNSKSTAVQDQQNVITQENTLTIALLNLAQLLQVSAEGFDVQSIDVGKPNGVLLYENSNMVYEKAVLSQPQIKNAELGIENSKYDINIARSRFLPTLSGSLFMSSNYAYDLKDGTVRIGSTLNDVLFRQINENLGYGVGIRLDIPIFNRLQTKNNLDRQFVNLEISKATLENEKLQLQQTIEQAYVDTKAAVKAYEAAKISYEAQQEAFKNAQESYRLGASTLFDFDLVRTRLVNAQATLIRNKYDFVFKTKVLQFYYGELNLD